MFCFANCYHCFAFVWFFLLSFLLVTLFISLTLFFSLMQSFYRKQLQITWKINLYEGFSRALRFRSDWLLSFLCTLYDCVNIYQTIFIDSDDLNTLTWCCIFWMCEICNKIEIETHINRAVSLLFIATEHDENDAIAKWSGIGAGVQNNISLSLADIRLVRFTMQWTKMPCHAMPMFMDNVNECRNTLQRKAGNRQNHSINLNETGCWLVFESGDGRFCFYYQRFN